jgi:hypothetical protein
MSFFYLFNSLVIVYSGGVALQAVPENRGNDKIYFARKHAILNSEGKKSAGSPLITPRGCFLYD